MCRMLMVRSDKPLETQPLLEGLAEVSRNSSEYQGHGWGVALQNEDEWTVHRELRPIWESDLSRFGRARTILAHARSAFRDRDIAVVNNMPFVKGGRAFAFNGELQGVRLRMPGRTGAARIFRLLERLDKGNLGEATRRTMEAIERASEKVRGCNLMVAEPERLAFGSLFSQREDYYTMHRRRSNGTEMVCSAPFENQSDWEPLPNRSCEVIE